MRLVSILGDSISTYEGYNPKGYAVFYDKSMQQINGLASVYDTWWAKVNQGIKAYLLVNNSFSGSRVTGPVFPAATSPERMHYLRTSDYAPDIILAYIGFNDFGHGVGICTFEKAYDNMLAQMRLIYPNTEIVCGTLMQTRIIGKEEWIFPKKYMGENFDDYNVVIRRICQKRGCHLADLEVLRVRYETRDGTHPTKRGHKEIADAWLYFLLQMNFITPTIETCIGFYHANKKEGYTVLNSLLTERILLPVNKKRNVLKYQQNGHTYFAVFTTPKQIPAAENICTNLVYIKSILPLLTSQKADLIINPFSKEELCFFLPYTAIEKTLMPLVKKQGG